MKRGRGFWGLEDFSGLEDAEAGFVPVAEEAVEAGVGHGVFEHHFEGLEWHGGDVSASSD